MRKYRLICETKQGKEAWYLQEKGWFFWSYVTETIITGQEDCPRTWPNEDEALAYVAWLKQQKDDKFTRTIHYLD